MSKCHTICSYPYLKNQDKVISILLQLIATLMLSKLDNKRWNIQFMPNKYMYPFFAHRSYSLNKLIK